MDKADIFVLDINFNFNIAPLGDHPQDFLARLQDLPQTRNTHGVNNAMARTAQGHMVTFCLRFQQALFIIDSLTIGLIGTHRIL